MPQTTATVETITVQNKAKWLFSQLGQLIIAVGLISLIFNYAYRYAVDWTVSSPLFYVSTLVLALIVFVAVRRDYVFVSKYTFGPTAFSVHTVFGAEKVYPLTEYAWIPALHKQSISREEGRPILLCQKDKGRKRRPKLLMGGLFQRRLCQNFGEIWISGPN